MDNSSTTTDNKTLAIYNNSNLIIEIINIERCATRILEKINGLCCREAYCILIQEFNIILNKELTDINNSVELEENVNIQIYKNKCITEYIDLISKVKRFSSLSNTIKIYEY